MNQFTRINPITGEAASSAPGHVARPTCAPIAARAHQGFAVWSKFGPNARRAVLMKAADAHDGAQGRVRRAR